MSTPDTTLLVSNMALEKLLLMDKAIANLRTGILKEHPSKQVQMCDIISECILQAITEIKALSDEPLRGPL